MTLTDEQFEITEEVIALAKKARTCFYTYVLLFNYRKQSPFRMGDLHEYLIDLAQDMFEGRRKPRQTVSVPPQHGKSTILSKEFVSWLMGRQPGINVALTSWSHSLVTDFSKDIKDRVSDPLYQLVFPDVKIDEARNQQDLWKLTNKSSLIARSTGKKLTGRRVDLLIIDDAHNGREEADNELARGRVVSWYFADCVSRLSPEAKVLIVGTRWHPEDLIGHLTSEEYVNDLTDQGMEKDLFEVTNLPALSEGEGDPLGRPEGEALFPEVRSKEFLESLKAGQPSYEWRSQYQGHPKVIGGGQVDILKVQKIDLSEVPSGLEVARGWDLAVTEKTHSDYVAGALGCYDKKTKSLYIIDIFREKMAWPKTKKKIPMMVQIDMDNWPLSRIGLEGVSGFEVMVQEIREILAGTCKVEKRNPKSNLGGSKLLRAQPWLNKVEVNKFFIVKGRWNKAFLDELEVFPTGKNDDQIDAVSILYEMVGAKQRLLLA